MFPSLNHAITIEKQYGRPYKDIPAHVQFPIIFVKDIAIPIEEGDLIHYTPSNNLPEHYIVVDRGFKEAIGSFPAHYQIKVERRI